MVFHPPITVHFVGFLNLVGVDVDLVTITFVLFLLLFLLCSMIYHILVD